MYKNWKMLQVGDSTSRDEQTLLSETIQSQQ